MTIDFAQLITAEAKAATELATRRAGMVVGRMQGILALGAAKWALVRLAVPTPLGRGQVIINLGIG